MHHTGGKTEVLLSGNTQQILNQTIMERAVLTAGSGHSSHIQKQNVTILSCHHITQQLLLRNGRIVFRKDQTFFHMPEDIAGAPVEVDDDIDTAGFYQTDLSRRTAGPQNDFILFEVLLSGIETVQQIPDFFFPDTMEERRVLQKEIIHDFSFSLFLQHTC